MSGSWPFVTKKIDYVTSRDFKCLISFGNYGYILGYPGSDIA